MTATHFSFIFKENEVIGTQKIPVNETGTRTLYHCSKPSPAPPSSGNLQLPAAPPPPVSATAHHLSPRKLESRGRSEFENSRVPGQPEATRREPVSNNQNNNNDKEKRKGRKGKKGSPAEPQPAGDRDVRQGESHLPASGASGLVYSMPVAGAALGLFLS